MRGGGGERVYLMPCTLGVSAMAPETNDRMH